MPIQTDDIVSWFTPLPPARNGIADYSAMLLGEMAALRPCTVYSDDIGTGLPAAVEVRDPAQAFRHLGPSSPVLHQIGNNGGHVFVLRALRAHGGVVSLHDLSLLYLYELEAATLADILGHFPAQAGAMGAAYARHWRCDGIKTAANYVLFDLVGEVLSRASRVIVHSEYARRKIAATHGARAAAKIDVVPHFAPRLKAGSQQASRAALGLPTDVPLILTSGFATRAKRFDWLVEALDRLAETGLAFRWVHAGEERGAEFDLSGAIAARPALASRAAITGYVSETDLDAYISAADIVVNLRFPSVGESSGTLARAFSAGSCCLVSDTAAYSEIPRDAAVHVPVFDTVSALCRALGGLLDNRDLRESFGARAKRFAESALALRSVATRYLETIDRAANEAPAASVRIRDGVRRVERLLGPADDVKDLAADFDSERGPFEVTLWFASPDAFAERAAAAPAMLRAAVAPHVEIETMRFVSRTSGVGAPAEVGIALAGRSHAGATA